MTTLSLRVAAIGAAILCLAPLMALAQTVADTKEEATKKDHLAIEGTWQAISLEVNGNTVGADDVKKITTENGRDGEWTLLVDGKDVAEGTSTIDPTFTPKTIDQGRPRPADFSATAGSGRMLVVFERVDATK